ncbi:hypothetical protein [Pseudoalteromonas denitrificans]|uniref:Uncharacterized protein n=1 Tax=Pseudoalteromonas denitrificans DSM 6059 TaxID=1123010 RepID=A0A1I1U0V4_9GAMM|nr:hypothetical protein [Pseudoalteromonas denitrificans]SFD61480.1 hypothetical protein SAMN02745724_04979 [Pseudoalteromonas denitrificans DSM 6059]
MKWISILVFLILSSLPSTVLASAYCDSLEKEREAIKAEFRKGYDKYLSEKLRVRDTYLFNEQAKNCNGSDDKNKVKDLTWYSNPKSKAQIKKDWKILNKKFPTMFANNKVYDGEKGSAWLAFYTLPNKCRAKSLDMNTFVWCSEDKTSQKKKFEKFWASGFKSKNDYLNKLASKGSNVTYSSNSNQESLGRNVITKTQGLSLSNASQANFGLDALTSSILKYWYGLAVIIIGVFFIILFMRKQVSEPNLEHVKIEPDFDEKTIANISESASFCPFCLSKIITTLDNELMTKTLICSDAPKCNFLKVEES